MVDVDESLTGLGSVDSDVIVAVLSMEPSGMQLLI
jgi:hypothetical protein